MIKLIQELLRETELNTPEVNRLKGRYKYPRTIKDVKNYLKLRYNE